MTNNSNTQVTQKLSQLLIQENSLAVNLLDLMLEEKNALEANLTEKLNEITGKKASCLDQLEFVSKTRGQLVLSLSSKDTTVSRMKDFINRQSTTLRARLTAEVSQLELTLENCKKQNSVNGMVISMSQRNVQRNLDIIKGNDNESMTYTNKGETTSIGKTFSGVKA